MTAATDILENMILQKFFIDDGPTFIGLHSADPTDAANQPEIAGGGYVRKVAEWSLDSGKITLTNDIVWVNLPAVNVVAFSIWNAETAGIMLVHQLLTAPKTVPAGEAFTLPKGNVTVTVD